MRNLNGRKHGELSTILTKEFLLQEHFSNRKTISQISKEVGCSHKAVRLYLDKYKLKTQIYDIYHPTMKSHPMWKGYGDISMSYWGNVIQGAKHRKLPFRLTIEEGWDLFLGQHRKCALSGRTIGFEHPKSNTASLDRIDSTRPYEKGNVQWVHRDLNYAKQSMTTEDFIQMCEEVSSYAKIRKNTCC